MAAATAQELSRQGSEVTGTPGQGTAKRPGTDRVTDQGAPQGKNGEARESPGTVELWKEPLSESSAKATPVSAGRQRRKPLKYRESAEDWDSDDLEPDGKDPQQKTPRKTPAKKTKQQASGKKSPVKRAAKRKAAEMDPDPDPDPDPDVSRDQDVEQDGPANPPKKTPAKKTPAKKTPAKKTPAKKTPAKKTWAAEMDPDPDVNHDQDAEEDSPANPPKKTPAKKTPAKKTPAKKTPKKKEAAATSVDTQQETVKEIDPDPDVSHDQDAEEDSPANPPKKTPAKKTPAKKTPAKKTPAKKTPAKKTPKKKEAAVTSVDTEQETVVKKKKTPKKKTAKGEEEAGVTHAAPACEEQPEETPEKTTPGGRPRRRAAQAAIKYLHNLATVSLNQPAGSLDPSPDNSPASSPERSRARPTKPRGRARKTRSPDYDSGDAKQDEDFVPGSGREDESEEENDAHDTARHVSHHRRQFVIIKGQAPNGLPNAVMKPVWDANKAIKDFRDEHCNTWVFPEWIPAEKDWRVLSERESARYLPQEQQSAAFTMSREGISEEPPLHRLHRFESEPAHPERWDALFFAGGAVWAMDWCPTPDGADARQYAAIYCHRRQDDQHRINQTYTEPGLVQLWDLGRLPYNSRPQSSPELVYGLAQDRGCVWVLKWCPGGAWELPSTSRKAPLMPRLGLLAAATSSGLITIYSLPHPDTLLARRRPATIGETSQAPLICQAEGVITLRIGSFKASHGERCGQVLSMDWLAVAPYNILAAGFYDGVVCLWDLSSKSLLQRIHSPDRSFTLLPYHCFLAHDSATRALAFCHASRDLLVTGGDDRMVKLWDLRTTYEPVTCTKRFLSTEAVWPLLWPGVLLAQENAYTPNGSQGLHYFEGGYTGSKPMFLIPRTGTLWSISMSDWLNSVVTSDTMGEVILVVMPNLVNGNYVKRSIERRFPVYFTDMVLLDDPVGGEEEEEEESPASTSNGPAQREVEGGGDEERETEGGGEEESRGSVSNGPVQKTQSFRKSVRKYYLHYSDSDMRSLKNFEKRRPWKRMQNTEVQTVIDLDRPPLAALHKIRFNPNLSGQSWVLSAGQAGLVRLHCLRALNSPHISKLVQESQNQFSTMFTSDPPDSPADAVRHTTQPL